ncbi:MAG: hypothetical protein ACREOD_06485 [Candidatus Dormibacteria bacterium]
MVYGVEANGNLVFIPEQRARALAGVVEAWWTSTTWGQFRERASALGMLEVLARFEDEEASFGEDEPLTAHQKGEYTADGDWPPWAAAEMLDWVPESVASLGDPGVSIASGPCLWFTPEQEEEVVSAFEAAGFACRRDDYLVNSTCGCDWQGRDFWGQYKDA